MRTGARECGDVSVLRVWACVAQLSSAGVRAKHESDTYMKTLCIIYKEPAVAGVDIWMHRQVSTLPHSALVGHSA